MLAPMLWFGSGAHGAWCFSPCFGNACMVLLPMPPVGFSQAGTQGASSHAWSAFGSILISDGVHGTSSHALVYARMLLPML